MVSNEIEYIEPTQEHVGQMVEVRDNESQVWVWAKLMGILPDSYKFAVKREKDSYSHAWRFARIPRPKPQPTQEQSTKPIDWTKPVRTKDGRPVRVLCTDGPGDYPVCGFVDKCPAAQQWTLTGAWENGATHEKDIENAPQRIQREYWVNVYPEYISEEAESKYIADEVRESDCLACVKITIDCEEGEGL